MNPDPALPTLLDWLARADQEAAGGWEPEPALDDLRCHPDLIARLAEIARPIGAARRRFVAGCPVIQHPHGRPIAAAAGTAWLVVRSRLPAGALGTSEPRPPQLAPDWVELDPWASDVALARALDLLRSQVATAYELAESGE